jgi:hypothetical protein
MSECYNAFIVVLDQNIRSDDGEATINAIKQIKGVIDVQPHVATMDDVIAKSAAKYEMLGRFRDFLRAEMEKR